MRTLTDDNVPWGHSGRSTWHQVVDLPLPSPTRASDNVAWAGAPGSASLRAGEPAETRSITESWADHVDMVPPLEAGSAKRALSLSAVYSANRLLAESISTLPVKAYRR
jgi:hypothetical protein